MALGLRSLLGGVVIFLAALVSATVDPVVIKGSHFFYQTNGSEFFIRGITYQPPSNSTPIDPLSVSLNCMRDIQFLSDLTTNVIRVSYIDSASDHSACMTALQTAGIYVLVDLPGTATINSTNPEWNLDIYGAWVQTIDAMAGFTNVLGFFAGDNVVTNSSNSPAAAFVKAAVRDLKSYIATKGYRPIPVGYEMSASDNYDVASLYMTCTNSSQSIDFLGISDFNWCTNNTYVNSGYENIINQYATYTVPVFFAEYGCKDVATVPREFDEVAYIYGTQMTNVISGGIVYEYFQDDENKGLVSIVSNSVVSPLPDFTSYSSQIAKITPSSTFASNYTVTNTITQSCPTTAFSASPTLPPIVNKDVCSCMVNSLQCVARSPLNSSTTTSLLEGICGTNSINCPALHGDGSTGIYGSYSMCNVTERLSWALDMKYQDNLVGCTDDPDATTQETDESYDCENVYEQAGAVGTGTITSFPTLTTATNIGYPSDSLTPSYYYGDDSNSLSGGAIAGIAIGSILGVAAIASGCAWFFCLRRRGFKRQNSESSNGNPRNSTPADHLFPPRNMRGGSASVISDDSRDMSELPQFDGSYIGQSSTQWSRTELHSIQSEVPAGYRSIIERDAAISEMHTPVSRGSDLEHPSPVIPPSPMGSEKELPAFRTRMEDKSLPSMKLLSPMIKVSPV
ncbi:uncharacterized protein LY89DRAFT_149451 [Mollisia scopiformis]|uniref:1,3-beta-glucanosyltransferase n=1 Tax=Mollisia scopiformis TaxID=149040 RepID=A0A194X227_MOLSC|nr:uncharacterized protein LY89DRAFT_149451 [Mollisia scopiformis]KUJ13897.1 hypothetical protein LY89DRAFT_149451 [Mollisia scopiformis]